MTATHPGQTYCFYAHGRSEHVEALRCYFHDSGQEYVVKASQMKYFTVEDGEIARPGPATCPAATTRA